MNAHFSQSVQPPLQWFSVVRSDVIDIVVLFHAASKLESAGK
jgi:hypothetical protein